MHSRYRCIDRRQSIRRVADVPSAARANVSDLDEAIGFYSKLFATEPAKVRPGYANFAIAEPPLKLVLIEGAWRARHAEPPRRRGRVDRRGRRGRSAGSPPRAWPPRPRTRSRVATRCRTRCGSTAPTASRGRSTPCSAMSRCRTGELRTVDPAPTRSVAQPRRSRRRAAADRVNRRSRRDEPPPKRVGTAFLVAIVVGSGIVAQRLSPDDVGLQLLENSTATGAGLVALILAFGSVSGAHFNPVVTLADRCSAALDTARPASTSSPDRRRVRRGDRRQPHVRPRRPSTSRPTTDRPAGCGSARWSPRSGCCS